MFIIVIIIYLIYLKLYDLLRFFSNVYKYDFNLFENMHTARQPHTAAPLLDSRTLPQALLDSRTLPLTATRTVALPDTTMRSAANCSTLHVLECCTPHTAYCTPHSQAPQLTSI
jgi:hypothetical protein